MTSIASGFTAGLQSKAILRNESKTKAMFCWRTKNLGNIQVGWIGDLMSTTSTANQKNYVQGSIDKRYEAILMFALDPESYADT